jgi:HSP20 family protein
VTRRRDIDRLRGELDELFADLWQLPRFAGTRRGFRPPVDCVRTDDPPQLAVVVDLAGIDPDEVQVVVTGRNLVISGERRRPASEEGGRYQQMEIDYGAFQRAITLPEDVDTERAEARYERGLLVIALPLTERRPRRVGVAIEVRTRP